MLASTERLNQVLSWARDLTTDRANSVAVLVNASPILDWLEAAEDLSDQTARFRALSQANWSQLARNQNKQPEWFDNPDRFLDDAKRYYAFITNGGA